MCAKFEPALHMYLNADSQCHADVTYIYNLQGYHYRVHIIILLCLHVVTLFTYSRLLRLWLAFYFIKMSPSPCTAISRTCSFDFLCSLRQQRAGHASAKRGNICRYMLATKELDSVACVWSKLSNIGSI